MSQSFQMQLFVFVNFTSFKPSHAGLKVIIRDKLVHKIERVERGDERRRIYQVYPLMH
jgi:hypothetical protein